MRPPLLPSGVARDHRHKTVPRLPRAVPHVFGLRSGSDLLCMPRLPVRPIASHDERASEERYSLPRSETCPWAYATGASRRPIPRRERGPRRRNAGSSMVRLLLVHSPGMRPSGPAVSKDSYISLRYLSEDSEKATKLFESPSPESVVAASGEGPDS